MFVMPLMSCKTVYILINRIDPGAAAGADPGAAAAGGDPGKENDALEDGDDADPGRLLVLRWGRRGGVGTHWKEKRTLGKKETKRYVCKEWQCG